MIGIREITGQPRFRDTLSAHDLALLQGGGRQVLADGYARGGPSNFGITERGVLGFFYDELDNLSSMENANWARRCGLFVPNSDVLLEKHRWLGSMPKPREHVGPRHAQAFNNFSFDVQNKDFELTIGISLHDWKRDQVGQLRRKGGGTAGSWEDHWVDRAVTTLIANPTCYDGVTLFSASHESGDSGSQTNELTSTEVPALNVVATGAPTVEEAAAIMVGMSSYMYRYKDDKGRPTNQSAKKFLFLVPTAIAAPFIQANNLPLFSGGGSNTTKGLQREFVVVAEPRLTSATQIYCAIMDRPESGALILQQSEDPTVFLLGENSEYCKLNKELLYLSDASRRVAPGQWREIARGTLN